jgi:hypothetical protein
MTAAQLRECIHLAACDHDALCCGYRWHIRDENALAELVACTLQGYGFHAARIFANLDPVQPVPPETVKNQAIQMLALPPGTGNVTPRWHRDGLIVQHIAWIAAHVSAPGSNSRLIAHPRAADKGFDALFYPSSKTILQFRGSLSAKKRQPNVFARGSVPSAPNRLIAGTLSGRSRQTRQTYTSRNVVDPSATRWAARIHSAAVDVCCNCSKDRTQEAPLDA